MAKSKDVEALFLDKGNQAAPEVAARVVANPKVLARVMVLAVSPTKRVKNGAAKTLRIISEDRPDLLVSRLKDFIRLMDAEDTILRWIAMDVVGNMAGVDDRGHLNRKTLDVFLDRVSDPSLVTAGHAVDNLGLIGLHKPRFRKRITEQLVQADAMKRTPECRAILAGKVLTAFSRYADEMSGGSARKAIVSYAKGHLRSRRPSTRKKAEKLLALLGEG